MAIDIITGRFEPSGPCIDLVSRSMGGGMGVWEAGVWEEAMAILDGL